MDAPLPSPQTEELLGLLDQLLVILREWNEDRWAQWIERDRRLIAEHHPDALGHLLAAFGGAGSLRDLSIHPVNGHEIAEDRIRPVNDRLRVVRGAVYEKATALRQAIEAQ